MSATVHLFPCVPAARPEHLPAFAERELAAIERWCERAQQQLAGLPGATLQQQRALRRIADELRAELLASLQPPGGA